MSKNQRLPNWADGFLARTLAGFLVIAVAIAALLSVVLTEQASKSLTDATQRSVNNLAIGGSLRLDTWLTARKDDMSLVAAAIQGHLDSQGAKTLLGLGDFLRTDFDSVQVVDPSGKLLFEVGSPEFQASQQSWFKESLIHSFVPPIAIQNGVVQWVVTARVSADSDSIAAVVIGDLRVNRLSDVLSDFDTSSTELHVVNSDHKVIYSSDWGTITDDAGLINKGMLRLSEANNAVDKALAGERGATRLTDYRGDDVISGYAPVAGVGWALIASELASAALAPVNAQLGLAALIAALAIAVTVALVIVIARWLARPVLDLSGAAARVAGGELATRVTPSGAREVRQLGERFNAMIDQLDHLVSGLRSLSSQASQSASKMSTAAEALAAATTEQTAAATETSASMEELARTSTSIAETLQRVSVQAQETRENLDQARADMQASGTRTLALAERVNDVNEIIGLINEIADQTNLLALNAAIEAARAGETGRGFAVVADEVRRLAERSKSSAGKISKIIENARSESNATVMAMEQSTKQMERGLKLLEDVVEASSQVQVITQQQRSATEQVLEAMEQIAAGSRQVSNTAQEISKAAAGQAGLAADMETMSRNGTGRS